jgi:hypothetical protein
MGRVTRLIGVTLVLAVFLSSMALVGCKGKKESTYGPGAAWVDDMRERIEDKIEEPRKATELLAVVDDIESLVVEMHEYLLNYYHELEEVDSDFNSTRDDFQVLFDERLTLIKDYAEHYEMIDDAKADELISTAFKNRENRTKLHKSYYKKFKKALGAKRAAKFTQLDNQIDLLIDLQIAANLPLIDE